MDSLVQFSAIFFIRQTIFVTFDLLSRRASPIKTCCKRKESASQDKSISFSSRLLLYRVAKMSYLTCKRIHSPLTVKSFGCTSFLSVYHYEILISNFRRNILKMCIKYMRRTQVQARRHKCAVSQAPVLFVYAMYRLGRCVRDLGPANRLACTFEGSHSEYTSSTLLMPHGP